MYQAFGLLKDDNNFSLQAAAQKLAERFPSFTVGRTGQGILLSSDDWEIQLALNEEPNVLEESRDFAERIGGREDGEDIASCASRVEVASDIPDPEMEHFNDYLQVIEVLKTFQGLIPIDPQEPSLL